MRGSGAVEDGHAHCGEEKAGTSQGEKDAAVGQEMSGSFMERVSGSFVWIVCWIH